MNVLVINAGSSSLKYQLLNPATGEVFWPRACASASASTASSPTRPQVKGKASMDASTWPCPPTAEAIAGRAGRPGGSPSTA